MDLPVTSSGNKHVLVFQHQCPMVYAIPTRRRIGLILVRELASVFGVPECLLSDRGTNLLSHLMTDVCKALGIKKLNTTAYHPKCDGLVERFNRTLKAMLRKHASRFGKEWDLNLYGAYRNTPHEGTGEKPSIILVIQDGPACTSIEAGPAELLEPSAERGPLISAEHYREQLVHTLASSRQLAEETTRRALQNQL